MDLRRRRLLQRPMMNNALLFFYIFLFTLSDHFPFQVVFKSSAVLALAHQLHHADGVLQLGLGRIKLILADTFPLLRVARVHNALEHVSETLRFTTNTCSMLL